MSSPQVPSHKTAASPGAGKRFHPRVLLILFVLASSLVFINHYTHLFRFTPEVLGKYFPVRWALATHILPGAFALLSGPLQFLKGFRNRYLKLHRLIGRLYVLAIFSSALSALFLTFVTTDRIGKLYTVSLWFLLLVWVTSTVMAWWTILKRKVQEHEEWMVRSYLCTFAFIVQNYILKIPAVMDLGSFAEVSPNIFWCSWAVPLFGYQVYLSLYRINRQQKRASS